MLARPGLVLVMSIFGLVIACALMCFQRLARRVPTNYILLLLFTVCEAYTVAFVCAAVNDASLVLQATFMTAGLTLGLSLYAHTTKTDFTAYGGLLWAAGSLLLIFSLFSVFFGPTMRLIYCTIGVALFSVYVIFDTQYILGGEGRHSELSKDDYVMGAMILYLDIVNLFLYIVQILASLKD